MSIVPLKKVTLIGMKERKQATLDALQYLGIMHLIPLTDQSTVEPSNQHARLNEALRYLNSTPQKRRAQTPRTNYDEPEIVDKVLLNKRQRSTTIDTIELIRARITTLKPWGDFSYPALNELDGQRLWFYCIPLSKRHELESTKLPWKILSQDHRHYYVVCVASDEPAEHAFPFERVHVGSRSLPQLREDLHDALVALEDLDAERMALTRWIVPLTRFLDESIDLERMTRAKGFTYESDNCFVIRGWLAASTLEALEALSQRLHFAYLVSDPEPEDNPPTLLQNDDLVGGGEAAISFFQLPGYQSWDPSGMIFFSFSLFFGIILADAGYALILALFIALYWKKLSANSQGRRLRNLAVSVIAFSTVYGVLIGSYFGIKLDPEGLLATLQLLDIHDFDSMLQLSIGIGVLHLIAANALALWNRRGSTVVYAKVGWILVIGMAFICWLLYLHQDFVPGIMSPPAIIIILGLALVFLFSGERPIHSAKDVLGRAIDGFIALYGVNKAFGDVLSYMRLFALGLSSASLAVTFNELAVSARESVPAGGFLLFLIIVLLGHLLNFVLAFMGGVIHGMRLNLLEFYNWAISGEGHAFDAFRCNRVPKDLNEAALDYDPERTG